MLQHSGPRLSRTRTSVSCSAFAGRRGPCIRWAGRGQPATCRSQFARCRVAAAESSTKEDLYNTQMQKQMGWDQRDPYKYHHDGPLYFHEILPGLICGAQPRNAEDIRQLALEEKVDFILNVSPCSIARLPAIGPRPSACIVRIGQTAH